MFDYKAQFSRYYDYVNGYLISFFDKIKKENPSIITDAMEYSVMNGGKRVRAVMCLAAADLLGVSFDLVKEYCVAIECIHAYSLVHDDLPAMDNDDYRRGKLSTHKKYGEANGILTGDALLNVAFETCLKKPDFNRFDARALYALANAAGFNGMIYGQVLDLENENSKELDKQVLYKIYENKTAKLITAPLLIASELAFGKYREELKEFGYHLGVTFQIVDDIMDVEETFESIGKTPNKDEKEDKLTSIKLFGIDGAKALAKEHYEKCLDILKDIPNSEFFVELTKAMYIRRK